jgi:geranylgeranyl pyrophosphate synthase
MPVLYALHWEQERDYSDLQAIYSQPVISEDHLSTVLGLLARCGAHEHARNRAREHCQRALDNLDAAEVADTGERPSGGQGIDAARQMLRQLALACVDRDS